LDKNKNNGWAGQGEAERRQQDRGVLVCRFLVLWVGYEALLPLLYHTALILCLSIFTTLCCGIDGGFACTTF
jgi:hypothetical protein